MAPGTLATDRPAALEAELRRARRRGWRLAPSPWMVALVVGVPLAGAYLVLKPASGDLAAATYRGELFARAGFTLWDSGWYGGHYLPGYSLLAPALGALVGERLLLALCAIAAAGLFGLLAQRTFQSAGARVAGASFALGVCVGLLSGRVAYGLGIAIGLLALLVLIRGWTAAALALAVLTSLASPVAGAFLALAGLAYALAAAPGAHEGRRRARWRPRPRGLAFVGAALAPIVALAVVFPEGGWEPFAPSLFWPALAGVTLIALALPRAGRALAPETRRMLTCGVWLYAPALAGAFVLRTPVGGNAARLGALLAAPLVAGVLWERRRLVLLLLAPALLYWQLESSINDFAALAGNPSVNASYYTPLAGELTRLADGRPLRVEVPLTEAHWESVYLPEHPLILLARGWDRQLDTRYDALFYGPTLTASAYRSWLGQNAVSYVALPDVPLDFAGEQEGRLVARGLPYLVEVWHSSHWRLFAVRDATPLAQAPAVLSGVGPDGFTLLAPRPGAFTVRVRFTPHWTIERGPASVHRAQGGWTEIDTRRAGVVRVGIDPL
ncbi:MAG TPA: hypothetical protein VIJ66_06770 [Solirubrobacteraceae bacterium]